MKGLRQNENAYIKEVEMGFVAKQPNGKYCRFSTVIECPTHINMTKEDYLNYRIEKAIEEVKDEVDRLFDENNPSRRIYDIEDVKEYFRTNVMTVSQFHAVLKKMEDKNGQYEETLAYKKITSHKK